MIVPLALWPCALDVGQHRANFRIAQHVGEARHVTLVAATDDRGRYERELLLEAYRQFRPFEDHWLQLIAPLRALRYIRYAAWIARRWEDPAFPEAFPQFGTEEYWEQETLDLEQELRRFGRAGADESTERAGQPQEELTNKDFFWDWEEDQSPKNG